MRFIKSVFTAVSVFFGCGLSPISQEHTAVFGHVLIYDLAVFVSSVLGGTGVFLLTGSLRTDGKQGTKTPRWFFYYPGMILLFFFAFTLLYPMPAERIPVYELLSSDLALSASSGGGNALAPGFFEKVRYMNFLMPARMIFGKGILSFYSVSLYVLLFQLFGYVFGKRSEGMPEHFIKKAAFTLAAFILSAAALCLAYIFLIGKDFARSLPAALSICSLCPCPLYSSVLAGKAAERLLVLISVFLSRFMPPQIWELAGTASRDDAQLTAEETAEQPAPETEEAMQVNG